MSVDENGYPWTDDPKFRAGVEADERPSDYRLGLERAAHECEWMARGYAAYLMQPLLDAAKRIREIPENPDAEPHCQRRDGLKPALPSPAPLADVRNRLAAIGELGGTQHSTPPDRSGGDAYSSTPLADDEKARARACEILAAQMPQYRRPVGDYIRESEHELSTTIVYADEAIAAMLAFARTPTTGEDAQAASELVKWWDTGVLPDGVVRAEGRALVAAGKADERDDVRRAEREIISRIVRRAAISPRSDGGE